MPPPLAEHSLPGTTFGNSELLQGNFRLLSEAEQAKVCAQPEGEPEWPEHGNSNLNSCLANLRVSKVQVSEAKVQVSEAQVSQARVLAPACSTPSTARGRAGQAEFSDGGASRAAFALQKLFAPVYSPYGYLVFCE